jgi:quercetin dioxygenase-like cupin family protein
MGGRASRITAWSEDGGVGRRSNKKGTVYRADAGTCGYKIPPHTHPTAENLTVISGTFNIGTGDKFDEAAGRRWRRVALLSCPQG